MPDTVFALGAAPGRYQDIVQRMSVLYPLRGPAVREETVRDKTHELVEQWRARIGALVPFGFLTDGKKRYSIMYARNCLPTFAMASPRTRPCNNRQICPFCYARRVRDIWMQLDANCPAPEEAQHTEQRQSRRRIMLEGESPVVRSRNFSYQLVERYHTFFRDVCDEDDPAEQYLLHNLATLLKSTIESRTRIVEMVDPLAAFCYTTVEPGRTTKQWKIRYRQLFKTAVGYRLPQEITDRTRGRINYHEYPTRACLMRIVSRLFSYPTGLMTGDPARVVQLMTARRLCRFRSYAGFRGFRNAE